MKRLLPLIATAVLLLSACGIDTTGISATSARGPHPKTDANAAVQVVEFGDLQCPACKSAYTTITVPLIAKYGTKIRFDFVHFPLQTLHQNALIAAEASECAADQGKFWEFLDTDYNNQEQLSKEALVKWAQDLGLKMDTFNRCLNSGIKKKEVLADYEKGRVLKVQGTPTYFVNGKQVDSGITELSAAIDDALAHPGQKL